MNTLPMPAASLLDTDAHDALGLTIIVTLAALAYAWYWLTPDTTVQPEQLQTALITFHTPDLRLVPEPIEQPVAEPVHTHGPVFDLAGCDRCWAAWQDLLASNPQTGVLSGGGVR